MAAKKKKRKVASRSYPTMKLKQWVLAPMLLRLSANGQLFVGMTMDTMRSRVDGNNVGHPKYGLAVFHGTLDDHTHDFKRALPFHAAVAALVAAVPDAKWVPLTTLLFTRKHKKTFYQFSVVIWDGVPSASVVRTTAPPGSSKVFESHDHLPARPFGTLAEAMDFCETSTLTEIDKLCTCTTEKVL